MSRSKDLSYGLKNPHILAYIHGMNLNAVMARVSKGSSGFDLDYDMKIFYEKISRQQLYMADFF